MSKLFLIGVACVGTSSIGEEISKKMDCNFYDFSSIIENVKGKTMPRLHKEFFTPHSMREHCRPILESFIDQHVDEDYVMALTPSCLMDHYWKALKTEKGRPVIAIEDRPENIMNRARFYDDDQRPLIIKLTDTQKSNLIKDIRADATYFRRSYKRADYQVDIDGRNIQDAADLILEVLNTPVCSTENTTNHGRQV